VAVVSPGGGAVSCCATARPALPIASATASANGPRYLRIIFVLLHQLDRLLTAPRSNRSAPTRTPPHPLARRIGTVSPARRPRGQRPGSKEPGACQNARGAAGSARHAAPP